MKKQILSRSAVVSDDGSEDSRVFHFAHIYNYSAATLTMLGQASGFEVEQALSGSQDRNLRILFRKSKEVEFHLDTAAYQQSIDAVTRHNVWSYHCRSSYLVDRVKTVWRHRQERRRAKEELATIVRACAGKAVSTATRIEAA